MRDEQESKSLVADRSGADVVHIRVDEPDNPRLLRVADLGKGVGVGKYAQFGLGSVGKCDGAARQGERNVPTAFPADSGGRRHMFLARVVRRLRKSRGKVSRVRDPKRGVNDAVDGSDEECDKPSDMRRRIDGFRVAAEKRRVDGGIFGRDIGVVHRGRCEALYRIAMRSEYDVGADGFKSVVEIE